MNFTEIPSTSFLRNPFLLQPIRYVRKDGGTDKTKLALVLRNCFSRALESKMKSLSV